MHGIPAFIKRNPTGWVTLVGGLAFVACFYLRYATMPYEYYQFRDDGIITLSHARNWIDYGFIGVNPSGERVEGFSAPVQFFLYSALYALTGISYNLYMTLQTWVCTFLLGACFISFFTGKASSRLMATEYGAILLVAHSTFIEWHGSGMENALTHVLFLATMLSLCCALNTGVIRPWYAVIAFLASISRLDSLYEILPMLVVFCAFWQVIHRTPKALQLSALTLTAWATFTAWRYYYFGSVYPNTAVTQGINIAERILFWQHSLQDVFDLSGNILNRQGLLLLASLAPLAFFLRRTRNITIIFCATICLCMLASAYFRPFFFSRATLDNARTTSALAVFISLYTTLLIYHAPTRKVRLLSVPLLLLGLSAEISDNILKPYPIGWGVEDFEHTLKEFNKEATKEHIPRPTVANADLGLLSLQKIFNIIDLGRLGSPILASLPSSHNKSNYVFAFAAPDLIESHKIWGCTYYDMIFHEPRFRELYLPVWEKSAPDECWGKERLSGIWVRKDMLANSGSAERKLVDRLAAQPTVALIEEALATCQSNPHGNCAYVARSAYRFLPEFRKQGDIPQLLEIFERSRIPKFSRYMVDGFEDAQAYRGAMSEILSYDADAQ